MYVLRCKATRFYPCVCVVDVFVASFWAWVAENCVEDASRAPDGLQMNMTITYDVHSLYARIKMNFAL